MGQAKQKGTFEQRKQAAYDRIDAQATLQAANLKRLDEAENQAEQRSNQMLAHFVGQTLKQASRQMPLMTADYTLIEGFGEAVESETIKAEVHKVVLSNLAAF